MKRIEKILLSLLVLIYLTHTYSRLVYKYPAHLAVSSGESQIVNGNSSGTLKKANIFHRRHLPLTKKVETGKLYPVNKSDVYNRKPFRAYFTTSLELNIKYRYPFTRLYNNKAPPFSC